MTNILAAIVITLTTNVVDSDNHQGCDVCAGIQRNNWALHHVCINMTNWNYRGTYAPATEKYRTTTCWEVATCKFEHNGHKWELDEKRVLWETRETHRRKEEWDIIQVDYYPIRGTNIAWSTNSNVILGVKKEGK
jgi:hypothetical protein